MDGQTTDGFFLHSIIWVYSGVFTFLVEAVSGTAMAHGAGMRADLGEQYPVYAASVGTEDGQGGGETDLVAGTCGQLVCAVVLCGGVSAVWRADVQQ
jgi:hypothetical protein